MMLALNVIAPRPYNWPQRSRIVSLPELIENNPEVALGQGVKPNFDKRYITLVGALGCYQISKRNLIGIDEVHSVPDDLNFSEKHVPDGIQWHLLIINSLNANISAQFPKVLQVASTIIRNAGIESVTFSGVNFTHDGQLNTSEVPRESLGLSADALHPDTLGSNGSMPPSVERVDSIVGANTGRQTSDAPGGATRRMIEKHYDGY